MKDDVGTRLSDTAMVLAAGFGTRMRPLTDQTPKPLLEVGGRAMLDRALDRLDAFEIARVVINTHHLGGRIAAHVKTRKRPKIVLSPEPEILETGGGVKNALFHFADKPFFVLSSDLPFFDGAEPAFARMARAWDEGKMDILMLVAKRERTRGFNGETGDYIMRENGNLVRKNTTEEKPFCFLSSFIVRPALYREIGKNHFSNNEIFDLAESRGRLFGLLHDGACYHVGTPFDLAEANRLLATGAGWT